MSPESIAQADDLLGYDFQSELKRIFTTTRLRANRTPRQARRVPGLGVRAAEAARGVGEEAGFGKVEWLGCQARQRQAGRIRNLRVACKILLAINPPTQKEIYYSVVPPDHYRFRVLFCAVNKLSSCQGRLSQSFNY
jgi:hypothetical protein